MNQKDAPIRYTLIDNKGGEYQGNYRQIMDKLVHLEYKDSQNSYVLDNKTFEEDENN